MTVEDGTGKTDSNSYVGTAFADAYFSERGVTAWASLAQGVKESLLIKASEFVGNSFRWNGRKKTAEQAMKFPRAGLYDEDGYAVGGVPVALMRAVCECADILRTETSLYSVYDEKAVTSERIGQLAFTYDVSQRIKGSTRYDSINLWLRGLYRTADGIVSGDVIRI